MKKLVSFLVCIAIVMSLCVPAFAAENNHSDLPLGIILYEGEEWVPADEDGIMPLEDANSECLKTGHIPPNGYRYLGYKRGNTRIDNITATVGGFIVSLIVPDMGLLIGLIQIGIAFDESDIHGDYTVYTWSNGVNKWEHVVGYATYQKSNGTTEKRYVNCEVRIS